MKIGPFFRTSLVLLVANLILLSGVLYGFEAALRWKNSAERNLAKSGSANENTWGHPVEVNSLGFREREFALEKPAGVIRIMVLGDSITWGAGLAYHERYSAQIEQMLKTRFPQRSFEVLNFGIVGGPTVKEAQILEEHFSKVQPDLIVVGFCLNDPQQRGQDYSVEQADFRRQYKSLLLFRWTLDRYGLREIGKLWSEALHGMARASGQIPSWEVALDRSYQEDSRDWKEFVEALARIKKVSDDAKLPAPILSIMNQGTSNTEPTDYSNPDYFLKLYLKWYNQTEQVAASLGFRVIRHEPEIIQELSDEPLAVNPYDGHPSANLNQIYARKIAQQVAELIESGQL